MEERVITEEMICFFEKYLYKEEKSTATVDKYLRDVRAFFDYTNRNIVTKELVIEYKQELIERGYAVRSVNSMLASLNCLMKYLGWQGCIAKSMKLQRQAYCSKDTELTKNEYMRLISAAEEQPKLCLMMKAICGTGIRVSELQYFTVEAVRRGEVSIYCKGKTRKILIPRKLKKMLLVYAGKRGIQRGAIFVTKTGKPLNRSNIWAQMKKLCKKAGIKAEKVFPHNLRKLFARTFYGMEKDIAKLADILGHSSIDTTRIYIMTTGEEHLEKIEKLGLVI